MYKLYQFSLSHYCEKVRWALDYKGIKYCLHNLVPGPHVLVVRRHAPATSVPLLSDGKNYIQDSTDILNWLDEKHPQKLLTPANLSQAKEALEWEELADREIGIHLRRFVYAHVLDDAKLAKRLLLTDAPAYGPPLYFFMFPMVRVLMRKSMNISEKTGLQSRARLEAALDKFSGLLQSRKFLVGGKFSRADIAVASLLAPLCVPPEHAFDWPTEDLMPKPLVEFKRAHEKDRVWQWVREIYASHRLS